jgi:hypothetical protein
MDLSPGERDAEVLFLRACCRQVTYQEAIHDAKALSARDELGGEYLRWLLQRRTKIMKQKVKDAVQANLH